VIIRVAFSSLRIQSSMTAPSIYHFLRDNVQKGAIALNYIPIDLQVANILLKPQTMGKFKMLTEMIGVI
jgi:hypothetical protein